MTAPTSQNAWRTACPDWKERIVAGRSLIPDLPLYDAVAEKALRIFKRLRVPDMIGCPTYGEVCEAWIFDLVRAVFGSYDPETKRRMIRQFFVMIPKKNGKSSIAAAIIVVAAVLNERPLAELILIAETQKIAGISFDQAAGIIRLDDGLSAILDVKVHSKTIIHLTTGATIRILSADGDIVTGSKAAYILVDETHVLGHKAKAAGVFLELEGGLASRPEGFFLEITTQSKVRPHGEFKRRLDRARAVRDGKLDLPMLPLLYELPPEMQESGAWRNEETWGLVNPNLERSVSIDYLRDKFAEAEASGPDSLALFASQHLNIEVGVGLNGDGWAGALHWDDCAEAGLPSLEALLDRSEVCTIGIDWGGADDLAALYVIGRERGTKRWLGWGCAWARPTVFERRKSIGPQLRDFERAGELMVARSGEEQAEAAADICDQVMASGLLPEASGIGLDSAGVALLVDALEERGMTAPLVQAVGQGWKLQTAISSLPLKLEDRRFLHGGQRIMGWSVGNAKQVLRGSNYVVTKEAAGAAKIDPLMAMFNAAMLMFLNPQAAQADLGDFLADPVMSHG